MKQAILVVSFGSSYPETVENCITATENKIAASFPDWDVHRSFTSYRIIEKIKKRDQVHVLKPHEALDQLADQGYEKVLVQPLHIMPGYEYEKIERAVVEAKQNHGDMDIHLGDPLIYANEDYPEVIEVLRNEVIMDDEHHAWVLMGHGTEHFANAIYSCLQVHMDEQFLPFHVGTVEGYPELDQVILRLNQNAVHHVTLLPFMLVAGDHAKNDMASDEEDSWKSVLTKAGFQVDCVLKGLGELDGFQEIYVNRVKRALDSWEA